MTEDIEKLNMDNSIMKEALKEILLIDGWQHAQQRVIARTALYKVGVLPAK